MKNTLFNIFKVAFSNVFTILSGVLLGFLLPKIIGIDDYGYYKTFTLYATYVGLFHFGIEDGIYLYYSGKSYEELNIKKFRTYFKYLVVIEIIICSIITLISSFFLHNELKFIFICVAIFMVTSNIINYNKLLSQITCRFSELSIVNIIQAFLLSASVLIFWVLYKNCKYELNYKLFILIYISIHFVVMLIYVFRYRKISVGPGEKKLYNEFFVFFKMGAPLLISNLCGMLILSLDRQFVNALFDNRTYAIYSFAYNMLMLITTVISSISTVIYPTIKKADNIKLDDLYPKVISYVLMFVFMCVIVYFPLVPFVSWFLPQYIDSLIIFRVILPGIAITGVISVVIHNYYKILNKNKIYFIVSLIILALSFVANLIAYLIYKNTIAISIASLFVTVIWFFVLDRCLGYKIKYNIRNYIYMAALISAFYLITCIDEMIFGFLLYVIIYMILSVLIYKKEIFEIFNKILKRKFNQ